MEVQERTRQRLADAVKELMETLPLDKITVTQIVERAGVEDIPFLTQSAYDGACRGIPAWRRLPSCTGPCCNGSSGKKESPALRRGTLFP